MASENGNRLGKVYLVGAGPGDPGLITVRGTQCLGRADLVLYDYLVNPLVLQYAPRGAELVCLGQPHLGRSISQDEINCRMVGAAREGKTVVRLKSGDPNLFGRGAEESEALTAAGIPFEVVPGVTAALAAAGSTGIPITHRQCASAVALITGHQREGKSWAELDYHRLAQFPGTLVFYMAMTTARQWSQSLVRGGLPPHTPVAVIRRATWANQEMFRTTLGEVAELIEGQHLRPPAVIIVGEAVGLAPETWWFTERPLFGVRILVSCAAEAMAGWWDRFAELGADLVFQGPTASADPLIDQWLSAGQMDWAVVASVDAARNLAALFGDSLRRTRLASTGPTVSDAIRRLGYEPAVEAADETIDGVVKTVLAAH